jgi:PucR C-terminal helix-turn-helix domain
MAPDQAGYAAAWLEFMGRLAAEPSGAPATVARVAALPSYGAVPVGELATGIQLSFAAALAAMAQRRPPGPDEDLSRYERSGERRARQRVALADLIQAWTIGLDVARANAFRRVPGGPYREAILLEAVELMTAWNTLGMSAAAAAHRQVEFQLALQEQHDAANVVRGILLGGAGDRALGDLERLGVDPAGEYYAVRVRPGPSWDLEQIERWLGTRQTAARPNGLAALMDGDVAGFVASRPADLQAPVCAGVAGPVPLAGIADAFRRASRALEAAAATGRAGLTDLQALGLIPAVLADADVSRGVAQRYIAPLERDGRAGATVLETVRLYLEHDCQVPPTAAALGVHPNTVRYRVSRFEQLTGSSLRHPESLAEAWWALRRHRATPGPGSRPALAP